MSTSIRDPAKDASPGPTPDPTLKLFTSSSVTEHVLRGVLGLVLSVGAFVLAGRSGWAMLLLVPAVVAWRGCPTCWTLGLAATLSRGRVSAAKRRSA